jgi:diamine N-acetyltransferase
MESSIRPRIDRCALADTELLADLGRRTFVETYGEDTPADQMRQHVAAAFAIEQVEQELLNPDSSFFIARVADAAAGFIKFNRDEAQTEPGNDAGLEIERLYVLTAFQGNGIGRLLFERALQAAGQENAEYIWLGVWERNLRGKSFWESLGFVEQGSHTFDFAGTAHTDLVMRRELSGRRRSR